MACAAENAQQDPINNQSSYKYKTGPKKKNVGLYSNNIWRKSASIGLHVHKCSQFYKLKFVKINNCEGIKLVLP